MLKWVSLLALVAFNSSAAVLDKSSQKENLLFDVDGNQHNESRKVEANIVFLTDVMDGFLVILDYDRDILMIKNTTSETCYFSRLDCVPIASNESIPVMVQEVISGIESVNVEQDMDVVMFSVGEKIPSGYIVLTNDVSVATVCSSQPSYWLEKVGATRNRRSCNWICRLRLLYLRIFISIVIPG
ncbi:hypothetical protein HOLleu_16715 [Holothuria leucospilota]|uniref:BRICHOS domain-containing protein n=1 Tax=Holothuria leucospilota TaxID=206669 RepID=A0A9Q1C667_HOLLE|nr:hypothetical protein HOLleu_16715 [Holothuria leucospilota]